MTGIEQRKDDHLALAASGDVAFHETSTLFQCVRLVHEALPELHAEEVDASTSLFGKRLRAPLMIAAMTGGVERAESINLELAAIAESRQIAFGLGSQRAMHLDPQRASTYRVRSVAPTTVVLGNVGIVQARGMSTSQVSQLVADVEADALCVHMNPAMELVQPGGDRDFRRGAETLQRLVEELGVPVVAKETGCGISPSTATKLRSAGVRYVDVSGAGGTSWVAVEMHRTQGAAHDLGAAFREWGIPTAASIALLSSVGFDALVATGGIFTGLEVAKAIALGAQVAGIARPVLQALLSGGRVAAERYLDQVEAELRAAMLLVGARDLRALRSAPKVVVGELSQWLDQLGGHP